MTTAIVVLFLLAAPLVSLLTGRIADAAGVREQHAEQAWHPVQAILEQSASAGLTSENGAWGAAWVDARWDAPGHTPHTGIIAVSLNAKAGQRVSIWVTGSGQITHPPLSHADVLDGIANAVLATVAGLAVLLGITVAFVRAGATRRRMAAWERDWEVIGPRWTSRR